MQQSFSYALLSPVDSGAQLSLAAFKKVDTIVVDVEADEIAVKDALKHDVDPW